MAQRSYLICAGPRTGSNLLATALRATKLMGRPFEYFNVPVMNQPWMLRTLGLPADFTGLPQISDRLQLIVRAGTSDNGVFGATVHWWDLDGLLQAIRGTRPDPAGGSERALDVLRSYFPDLRFIWLRRTNTVAQGISHYLARATRVWSVRSNASNGPQDDRNVPFDFAKIHELVHDAELQAEGWRGLLLGAEEITLALTYEEFAADFAGCLRRVLGFLGQPVPADLPPVHYRRQSDERSLEWERRYRSKAGLAGPPTPTLES